MLEKLMELDNRQTRRMNIAEKPGKLRTVAAFLAHSGDSWFWLLGLAAVWLLGDQGWKARAVALACGILITAVLVLAIKFTVRRRRPAGEWGGIYRFTDPHSFPSGHAARAIMLAIMAWGLGPVWLSLAMLLWAPLVTLARVAMGVHYLSDVLAGALVGSIMGVVVLHFLPPLLPFLSLQLHL